MITLYGGGQVKSTVLFGKYATPATINYEPPTQDDYNLVTRINRKLFV